MNDLFGEYRAGGAVAVKAPRRVPDPWPHQQKAVEKLRYNAGVRGIKRQIACMPTGAGKTYLAGFMIKAGLDKSAKIVFLADRVALIRQTSAKFREFGLAHGVIQAGYTHGRHHPLQIASIQTIEKRGFWPGLGCGYVDECHTRRKSTEEHMINSDIPWIGLTATPMIKGLGGKRKRRDGKIVKVWEDIVNVVTTDELVTQGYLVPIRAFPGVEPDMEGAKTNSGTGEWTGGEVTKRGKRIIGNIVEHWKHRTKEVFGGPVKTLVFSATVQHGEDLAREFQKGGHDFRQISYLDRDDEERERKIELYRRGDIDGLISCEALSKGFDVPDTMCMISARPYRTSLAAWIQQLGRLMRSSPDKEFGLLLDHSGNYLGFEDDMLDFFAHGPGELDEGKKKGPLSVRDEDARERKERLCGECGLVMPTRSRICPGCGWEMPKKPDYYVVKGDFREARGVQGATGWRKPENLDFVWQQASLMAVNRKWAEPGTHQRYAAACYKALTGLWPRPYGRALEPAGELDPALVKAVHASFNKYRKRRA